ncbi:MAG: aminotransferase class IV [Bifidobacteriaceae bacterium]|jgi:branched-chain amino acid aminotransferase|nr:aminotransferase class IV [Bifidobacteriaceae bacterium]
MTFDDAAALAWVNGELVPAGQAALPLLDHGITVGDGVFEAMKLVHGQVFALTRHLRRMERSAAGLGLAFPGEAAVREAVAAVVAANAELLTGPVDVLRVTLTAGRGSIGSGRLAGVRPSLFALVTSHELEPATTSVITVPFSRNERGALVGLKTTSYAENALALSLAQAAGASEALFPNTAGRLTEGTGSNVFLVLDGALVTPPLSDGPLGGVTRDLLLEWTEAVERSVPMSALWDADEVFITSSGRNVQAVVAADGRLVGGGALGPVTEAACEAFASGQARAMDPL